MSDEAFGWRPIEPGDAGAWARLLAAIQAADQSWDFFSEQDVREEFADPRMDFPRGSMAVFDGDAMIGYGTLMVRDAADPVHEMHTSGGVHPDGRRRGLGRRLLEWAEQAAVPLHQSRYPDRPLSLCGACMENSAGARALYATRGYEPVRWFHGMIRDLSAEVPAVPLADGVEIVPFTLERSEQVRLIRNEAFQDHRGSTETSAEAWAHHIDTSALRPVFSFLAYDRGTPAGFVLSHEYDAYRAATGIKELYIALVGTRRAARKRGLASALMTRALTDAQAAGFAAASLGVDADSPTGAVGLYRRLGFTVENTSVTLCKPLPP
jgi:mycothiol synthase